MDASRASVVADAFGECRDRIGRECPLIAPPEWRLLPSPSWWLVLHTRRDERLRARIRTAVTARVDADLDRLILGAV